MSASRWLFNVFKMSASRIHLRVNRKMNQLPGIFQRLPFHTDESRVAVPSGMYILQIDIISTVRVYYCVQVTSMSPWKLLSCKFAITWLFPIYLDNRKVFGNLWATFFVRFISCNRHAHTYLFILAEASRSVNNDVITGTSIKMFRCDRITGRYITSVFILIARHFFTQNILSRKITRNVFCPRGPIKMSSCRCPRARAPNASHDDFLR